MSYDKESASRIIDGIVQTIRQEELGGPVPVSRTREAYEAIMTTMTVLFVRHPDATSPAKVRKMTSAFAADLRGRMNRMRSAVEKKL